MNLSPICDHWGMAISAAESWRQQHLRNLRGWRTEDGQIYFGNSGRGPGLSSKPETRRQKTEASVEEIGVDFSPKGLGVAAAD